jgi:hypothetical protein
MVMREKELQAELGTMRLHASAAVAMEDLLAVRHRQYMYSFTSTMWRDLQQAPMRSYILSPYTSLPSDYPALKIP